MKDLWSFTGALLVVALALGGCGKVYDWHQKLTVSVETPTGTVSGAAVVAVRIENLPTIGGKHIGNAIDTDVTGEATVVEVAPGKYLFALLGGSDERASATFRDSSHEDADAIWSHIDSLRTSLPLPRAKWPLLVTFADITNPQTVRVVSPDDLAATFGPGFALKSIILEITDEPVTKGRVDAVLGWLKEIKGRIKPTNKRYEKDLTAEEKLYSFDFERN